MTSGSQAEEQGDDCMNFGDEPLKRSTITIGTLARITGTTVETIRYYERNALLAVPTRTVGRYRSYEVADLERLSFIRKGRDLGFSLDKIRALLALADDQTQSCAAVDAIAREHLTDVKRKIADLRAMQKELDRMIAQCGCGTVADCHIIETLSPNVSTAVGRKPR